MSCPKCGRPSQRKYKGYCTKVHLRLSKQKQRKLRIPCASCGDIQVRNPSEVAKSGRVFCKNCGKNSGEQHPKWKEGQYVNKDGYRMVFKDGRYQREHRVVWEETNNACLIPWSNGTIHHIDFTKLNNTPDNLLLLSDSEHGRFHRYADLGRVDAAARILVQAGIRQSYYPRGIDTYVLRLFLRHHKS